MKNKKGFTLVELVIVIIIVGILSIVGVVTYREYVQRAIETEAMALMGTLANAEDIYYTANGEWYVPEDFYTYRSYDSNLDVNCSGNKYFTAFRGGGTPSNPCLIIEYEGKSFRMWLDRRYGRRIDVTNGTINDSSHWEQYK